MDTLGHTSFRLHDFFIWAKCYSQGVYKDGVALAPKYGYSGDGPSLCTSTGFLTHTLQGFLSVGTLQETPKHVQSM
jgi:hypothetical protein